MGIVAVDLGASSTVGLAEASGYCEPVAIHRTLTKQELPRLETPPSGSYFSCGMDEIAERLQQQASGALRYAGVVGVYIVSRQEPASPTSVGEPDGWQRALQTIKSAFPLTDEQLMTVLGLRSRKTIHNWRKGLSEPQADNARRVFEVMRVAKNWLEAGTKAKRRELIEPLMNGQSILDMLCAKDIDPELISMAGSRLMLRNLPGDGPDLDLV